MYFRANVNPVSFRSTIRTFPNAPLPTTRSNRKWLRFTDPRDSVSYDALWESPCHGRARQSPTTRRPELLGHQVFSFDREAWLTFISEDHWLAIGVAHRPHVTQDETGGRSGGDRTSTWAWMPIIFTALGRPQQAGRGGGSFDRSPLPWQYYRRSDDILPILLISCRWTAIVPSCFCPYHRSRGACIFIWLMSHPGVSEDTVI